nr:MAG TPA: hypothetical protein [Caudoviricetes sp.]
MFIQSQNKKIIINTKTMISLYQRENQIFCLTDYDADSLGFLMGSYKNEEEANDVLLHLFDEIKGEDITHSLR